MNKIIISLLLIILSILLFSCRKDNEQTVTAKNSGTISISGAWALYPLVVKWAEIYQKQHAKILIDISAGGAGKGMADAFAKVVDLGMLSRDIDPLEIKKNVWYIQVAKDAVVPTFNKNNPLSEKILSKGIKRQDFIDIFINQKIKSWKTLFGGNEQKSIALFTRSDACGAAQTWAQYLKSHQEDLKGIGVYGDPGLVEAVNKNILGMGFNNINYAYNPTTKKTIGDIKIIPIDTNENGKIDPEENFYENREQLINAILSNKYPSPPARMLYLVANRKPEKRIVKDFLKWILTDGQAYVAQTGYIHLSDVILKEQIKKLIQ